MIEENILNWIELGDSIQKMDLYKKNLYIFNLFCSLSQHGHYPLYFYYFFIFIFFGQIWCLNLYAIKDIEGDTSGSFRKILLALLDAKRPTNNQPDYEECEKCAKLLYESSKQRKSAAETFTKIFTEKSQAEFIRIAQLYYKLTKTTLLQAVEKEFSGDSKEALIGIIYAMISPSEYFAKRVYKAVKGLGTDNTTLIRILITRDEIDMPQIKQFYQQLYKKDMLEAIKDDTSGNYRKILIELASH